MVDVHCFHYEIHLVHMLRVANPGDDLGAAQILGKRSYDDVLLVVVCAGNEKVKIFDTSFLEKTCLLCISCNSHNIILVAYFIKNRFVCVKNSYGMITAYQSIYYFKAKLAGPDNCNPHNLKYLTIFLDIHFILPHNIKFASMAVLL